MISHPAMSSTTECGGYHWSQGQYVSSTCGPESSTFFIILGFTMLVLVLLLFVVVIIACIRKQRLRTRARPSPPLGSQENEDDCVIDLAGIGESSDELNGRNLDNVKAVIMAGEDKATFIAHPIPSCSSSTGDSRDEEEQEVNLDELALSGPGEQITEEVRQEVS